MLTRNGLELIKINSEVEILDEINDIEETLRDRFNEDGFVVAYLTNRILIGKYLAQRFEFFRDEKPEPQFLLRLRVFNQKKELLLWNSENKFRGRLRIDDSGGETFVVDACQLLWGTDSEPYRDGYTRVFEKRGTELILPFSDLRVNSEKKRVFIKTRNYVEFNPETNLASYCDCRFVEFLNLE